MLACTIKEGGYTLQKHRDKESQIEALDRKLDNDSPKERIEY
jgi:hypothetical protein